MADDGSRSRTERRGSRRVREGRADRRGAAAVGARKRAVVAQLSIFDVLAESYYSERIRGNRDQEPS